MSLRPTIGQTSSGGAGDFTWDKKYFSEGSTHSNYSLHEATSTFGSATELWSNSYGWVASDFNSPEFGVAFRYTPANAVPTRVTVHNVRVTVCYELASSKGSVDNATANSLRRVTMEGPLAVTVGADGAIYTSADKGANWISRTSGTNNDLLGLAYRAGEFIATGRNGTVLSSSDGITWSSQAVGSPQDLYSVHARAGRVLIGGTNEELLYGSAIASLTHGKDVQDPFVDPNA